MRVFFLFFIAVCFLLWTSTIKEAFEINPEQQRGTILQFKSMLTNYGVTSSEIQIIQDRADKHQEQITRIEAILTQIVSK